MTLDETLQLAESGNRELWEAVFDSPYDGSIVTHKVIYLLGLIDVAIEHQDAVVLLVRHDHNGSAMSLVRCVLEAMYKGAWTISVASEQNAERMLGDRFDWPKMGEIVTQADAALNTGGFFASAKAGNWKSMNSFTHTGGLQIARRFTANELHASYSEEDLKFAVISTLTAIGLLAVAFLRSLGREEGAKRAEGILLGLAHPPALGS